MAMREYQTVVNGVRTTVQLSDEDAKRAGLTGSRGQVGNKARTTEPGLSATGAEAVGDSSRRSSGSSGKRAQAKSDDDTGKHE